MLPTRSCGTSTPFCHLVSGDNTVPGWIFRKLNMEAFSSCFSTRICVLMEACIHQRFLQSESVWRKDFLFCYCFLPSATQVSGVACEPRDRPDRGRAEGSRLPVRGRLHPDLAGNARAGTGRRQHGRHGTRRPDGRFRRHSHELLCPVVWPQTCQTQDGTSVGCFAAEWTRP